MISLVIPLVVSAFAIPTPQTVTDVIDASFIPPFGAVSGIPSATQPGSCQGASNINIPCQCPPNKDVFQARLTEFVSAGSAFGITVSFPTDNSVQSQLERVNACIVTLQNIDNTVLGEGCPIAAAPNFSSLQEGLLQLL